MAPAHIRTVGEWYEDFSQTTDDDVVFFLTTQREHARHPSAPRVSSAHDVVVAPEQLAAPGRLVVPESARGIVVFAHGNGSSRSSPRNLFVAQRLEASGCGTLLFDLLSDEETVDHANVFDAELLAVRLLVATRWVRRHPRCAGLPVGYFGASTGAGAALLAAAEDPTLAAVVSRGGLTDLASSALTNVFAPTLLIVGGNDPAVRRSTRMRHDGCGASIGWWSCRGPRTSSRSLVRSTRSRTTR